MVPKKSKAVTINWLQRNLFAMLPEAVIATNQTLWAVRDHITKIEETPSTVSDNY
jgi:hypothetical protein